MIGRSSELRSVVGQVDAGNGDAGARGDASVTLPLSVQAIVWLERKLDARFGAS